MRNLRALVVDDSSLNRRTIAAMLEKIEGVSEVRLANDGADALRVVEASPPDFITLDLEMPRLDGFEFLRQQRESETNGHVPVIVLTAKVLTDEESRELEAATIGVLSKHAANERTVAEEVRSILQG